MNYIAHWEAARCRVSLKKYQDAINNCKAVIELKKDWYMGYLLYGECCYNLNDFNAAYWSFSRGLRYAPDNECMLRFFCLTEANLRLEKEIMKMKKNQKDHFIGKNDKRKTGSHFTSLSADCYCYLINITKDYFLDCEDNYVFSNDDYLYIFLF